VPEAVVAADSVGAVAGELTEGASAPAAEAICVEDNFQTIAHAIAKTTTTTGTQRYLFNFFVCGFIASLVDFGIIPPSSDHLF
jgi:hypothetical protein